MQTARALTMDATAADAMLPRRLWALKTNGVSMLIVALLRGSLHHKTKQ